jgi:hypothetical protein
MDEKRTKEDNDSKGGLNDGNPNRDRTPIQPREETNLVGGSTQHNFEDEKEGRVPDMDQQSRQSK